MSGANSLYAGLAVGAGVCLALQAAVNGAFRRHLDNPLWATFFSVCGTILFATAAMLVIRPAAPPMESVRTSSWWQWVGGPLGTLIVLSGAVLAPRLGALLFLAFVVAGQLGAALALEHYGALGLTERPLAPGRAAGAALIVLGVACVWYFTDQQPAVVTP